MNDLGLTVLLVDSMIGEGARGGPAGVCSTERELSAATMQALAREINRPETAFVVRSDAGLRIRWFTPVGEVPLCGYATLAAAHVLGEQGGGDGALCFASQSGELRARLAGDVVALDFPEHDVTPDAAERYRDLFAELPSHAYRTPEDVLLVLDGAEAVRSMTPTSIEGTSIHD